MEKQNLQSFIDELLSRVDIVEVFQPFVTLKKQGHNYLALCPFHQEKTASFCVNPAKQLYYCFGCGTGGNAINFLMAYERLSFMEALETLAHQAGMPLPQSFLQSQKKSEHEVLTETLSQVMQYYQKQLQASAGQKAKKYLVGRGLSSEIIQRFSIGYALPGWDNLSRHIYHQKHQYLQRTGMLIQKDKNHCYDRFRDRIMFPIRNRRGRVIAFGGRVLNDETPKYLNSPETSIFQKRSELYGLYEALQANRQLSKLIVVEGYMDVIALAQYGVNYAVATLGTAITANHVERLFRLTSTVIFCLDGDTAGQKAAWRTLEILMPVLRDDWQVKFMFLSEGEDPDSAIRQMGQAAFESAAEKAATFSAFFLDGLSCQVDLTQMDGRARLVSLAMPYIQKMQAHVLREMLLQALAERANIAVAKLQQYLEPIEEPARDVPNDVAKLSKMPQLSLVRLAVTLLIQYPELIREVTRDLPALDLPGMDLLQDLVALLRHHANLTTAAIIEHFREKPVFNHLVKLANQEFMLSEAELIVEFQGILKQLHLRGIDHALDQLMEKAASQDFTEADKKCYRDLLEERKLIFNA